MLVLVVFTVLSATYSLVTRLKYGPDEPAHFIYVRTIATDIAVPPISHEETPTEESTSSHEAHQPPLYYALMAVPHAVLDAAGVSADTIWRILRLLNIPLGIIWLLGVYTLALEFFKDRPRATFTTALTALIPTAAYTFGVINNENLITPLFTWALVPLLRYFKSGTITRRSAIWLGVVTGLAILAKAQGLILIPILLIESIAILRRGGYRDWKPVGLSLAAILGIAAIVSGWWFVVNKLAYGSWIPQSLYRPVYAQGLSSALVDPAGFAGVALAVTRLTYGHFWIPYWLIQPLVPYLSFFYPLCVLSAIILAGFGARILRNGDLDRPALAFLLLAPLMVYLAWLRHALFVDIGAQMQGRLFICVAAVAGIIWVVGIEGLTRSPRLRRVLLWIGIALLLAANIAVILCAPTQYGL